MPTREQVRLVLERVRRGSDIAYFFGELTSPEWIAPLREEGLFDEPPGSEAEGDWVRYPDWPAARYLVRVSSAAPSEVLKTIRVVPDVDNPRVHDAFVEAALGMPAEIAAQLAPDVVRWLQSPRHLLLMPEHASKLMSHLASNEATAEALMIAEALLAIDPPSESDYPFARPSAHVGEHEFTRVLDEICGPLVEASGVLAFKVLMSALATALAYRSPQGKQPPFEDFSYIWRPNLAEGERSERDPAASLVDAIVRAAKTLIASDGPRASEIFSLLANGEWKVQRRIALHLLAQFPEQIDLAAATRLTVNAATIRDPACEHELQSAISTLYPLLPDKSRTKYIKLIRNGPIASPARRKTFGDQWDDYVSHWQSKRLAPIFHSLNEADRLWASSMFDEASLESLIAKPRRTSGSFVGPTTPLTPDELSRLSVDEILEFLAAWEPSGEWTAPSREGLGRAFSSAVAMNPRRFASAAQRFVGHDPVYVRSLISGLREATQKEARISWQPVLTLCEWVTKQSLEVVHADWKESDRDPGWSWTWTEIARLLSNGMIHTTSGLPKSSASRIWNILEKLSQNPEPQSDFPDDSGRDGMDPATLSINTGRGEALHAVVRYAWWESKGNGPIHRKVRSLLERHADPNKESSAAVHSVFGRWLSLLLALDQPWTQELIKHIFPTDSDLDIYRKAAWDSFILFDRPTRSVFESAERVYSHSFRDTFANSADRHRSDRIQATAQHVAIYYLWSLFELTDRNSLLQTYLNEAPDEARAELIAFAGRLLRNEDAPGRITSQQVELLKQLWLYRRNSIEQDNGAHERELAAFSWWCGAPSLEPEWWLPQLQWIMSRSIEPDPAFLALEALPQAAAADPPITLRVLRALLDTGKSPWTFMGHIDDIRNTISIAMESGDETTTESARQLINELGAREIADLSDLL